MLPNTPKLQQIEILLVHCMKVLLKCYFICFLPTISILEYFIFSFILVYPNLYYFNVVYDYLTVVLLSVFLFRMKSVKMYDAFARKKDIEAMKHEKMKNVDKYFDKWSKITTRYAL